MKKIAYLSSKVTLAGSSARRADAFEHDYMMTALREPFRAHDLCIKAIDWAENGINWADYAAAIIGTTWDYCDHWPVFVQTLNRIEGHIPLYNNARQVSWNGHKTYLRDLQSKGAMIIPTLWFDHVTPENVTEAFDTFGGRDLVFKRQIGAGANGQHLIKHGEPLPNMPHPMMVQPFLPTIQNEGEFSFIFIDGQFCHALIKQASSGDYRVQSIFGGTERAISPTKNDLQDAQFTLSLLDEIPLYARIDMVRGPQTRLQLMEMEIIEPYLYPMQGPQLGPRLATAMARRLDAIPPPCPITKDGKHIQTS